MWRHIALSTKTRSNGNQRVWTNALRACLLCRLSLQEGEAPLDEQFGFEPGAVTAGLAALLALAGIEFSYDKSPKWLQAYLLFELSGNMVRSETEQMGALQEKREEVLIQQSQDEHYLQERQRNFGQIAPRLYGSIDAAKVRIEPRSKKGEEKAGHEIGVT